MTETLDAEVVSDETTFEPRLGLTLLGWCNDALNLPLLQEERNHLHSQCPAIIGPFTWPDPSRKGSHYTTPARRCSCKCHTRPVL